MLDQNVLAGSNRVLRSTLIAASLLLYCMAGAAAEVVYFQLSADQGFPMIGASSRLQDPRERISYHEYNLFDRSIDTAWVEGVEGQGTGERVWFSVEPHIDALQIINGYAQTATLHAFNSRVRELKLSLWATASHEMMINEIGPVAEGILVQDLGILTLLDTRTMQTLPLSIDWGLAERALRSFVETLPLPPHGFDLYPGYLIVCEIVSVYPGSRYQDTCIAEISWTVKPEQAGPGGIRRSDLGGQWVSSVGTPRKSIIFNWGPFAGDQEYYIHGPDSELLDTGSWSLGPGGLIMESDGRGMIQQWPSVRISSDSLILSGDGKEEIFNRVRY